jgi:hypothetical protein
MDTDTITIIFPEVKVKIPLKGLTFDIIENMIFEISQHIARKVFEKALTDLDDYLRNKRERGKLKNTGKREKYFLTVSVISSIPVPVTRTDKVKAIIS